MPRKAAAGAAGIQPLNLGRMAGALQIPNVRRPTRGALGGSAPRGARTRLPPALGAASARGGAAMSKPKAKKSTAKKRRSNV